MCEEREEEMPETTGARHARPWLPVDFPTMGPAALPRARPPARPLRVAGALGLVYLIWGSTYLAIRVGVRTIPPLLMASVRHTIAGAILLAWSIRRGDRAADRLGRPQWRTAIIVGGLLLLGGNGGVSWAEQRIPSGIAALVVATVALWMALIARAMLGERIRWPVALGLTIGFGGLWILVAPARGHRLDPAGVATLLLAALAWAVGSVYARRAPLPSRPLVGAAMELLAGGAWLGIAGIAGGEISRMHPSRISGESLAALAYLIMFGSIVAFSAYIWLLHSTRTSLVSTYAYVNPIVAVLLGWALLGEQVTSRTFIGGGVIVAGVALIVTSGAREARQAGETERIRPG